MIPSYLISKLARETGVEDHSRTFSPWSHVVSLMYTQLTHSIGLNDVCDSLRLRSGPLSAIRGATAPSRNTLSYANRTRDCRMAEKLFWKVLEHLQTISPGFAAGRQGYGLARRFRRTIHVVDVTVIELVASCMDWAQHRRRKAAAKCHLRLNLQTFLPNYVLIDTAREHDAHRAQELCASICRGEIVIFDKAYIDFNHLGALDQRGVYWITRAKDNMAYDVKAKLPVPSNSKILRDEIISLKKPSSQAPELMRRIVALVELDGTEQEIVFLTNNLEWSPSSVADLYRCRWQIETFFKQLKQTLQLSDFLGHNANAVRWQIWTALLVYLLLRFQAFLSRWNHSFIRLFTVLRAALWQKFDLLSLLQSYGTAGGSFRLLSSPYQAYLPGFA